MFDELLSSLDAKFRVATRTEMKNLRRRLRSVTVDEKRDRIEAMSLTANLRHMHLIDAKSGAVI